MKDTVSNGASQARSRTIKSKAIDVDKGKRDPVTRYEVVTPAKASEYLKRNKCNRTLRESVIKRYASDMAAGKWRVTHQGLAFDRRGNLLDGQHRLHAVILSQVTVRMAVTRDLPADANDGLDSGLTRGVIDALHYRGIQTSMNAVGIIRWMMFSGLFDGRKKIYEASRSEKIEFFIKHQEAISFVKTLFDKGAVIPRMRLSCVWAVFARAYYNVKKKDRLAHAADVLVTGLHAEGDRWLILLRNWLLYQKNVQGDQMRREIYAKTERALSAWLKGEEVLGNLRPARSEQFLLPGEGPQSFEVKGEGAPEQTGPEDNAAAS